MVLVLILSAVKDSTTERVMVSRVFLVAMIAQPSVKPAPQEKLVRAVSTKKALAGTRIPRVAIGVAAQKENIWTIIHPILLCMEMALERIASTVLSSVKPVLQRTGVIHVMRVISYHLVNVSGQQVQIPLRFLYSCFALQGYFVV